MASEPANKPWNCLAFHYRHVTFLQDIASSLWLWPASFLLRHMILDSAKVNPCLLWFTYQWIQITLSQWFVLVGLYCSLDICLLQTIALAIFMVPSVSFTIEGKVVKSYKRTYSWRIQLETHLLNNYSPFLISDQDLSGFSTFNVYHVDFYHVYSTITMLCVLTEVNIFILAI